MFSALILDLFAILKHGINLLVMMMLTCIGRAVERRMSLGT